MIRRTAQEWADFTGEEMMRNENTCNYAYDIEEFYRMSYVDDLYISDFDKYKIGDIIKPSEPHVLIPARLLNEAGELIQRMNSALDGKIKEREEKRTPSGNIVEYVRCPHCNDILRLSVVKTCLSCGKPV